MLQKQQSNLSNVLAESVRQLYKRIHPCVQAARNEYNILYIISLYYIIYYILYIVYIILYYYYVLYYKQWSHVKGRLSTVQNYVSRSCNIVDVLNDPTP